MASLILLQSWEPVTPPNHVWLDRSTPPCHFWTRLCWIGWAEPDRPLPLQPAQRVESRANKRSSQDVALSDQFAAIPGQGPHRRELAPPLLCSRCPGLRMAAGGVARRFLGLMRKEKGLPSTERRASVAPPERALLTPDGHAVEQQRS